MWIAEGWVDMMREDEQEQQKSQESHVLKAGLTGAQTETVQRYGAAIKEHAVAYAGIDRETGQVMAKGLKEIAGSKVNPNDSARNIKQQAGFSAEVKTEARENAEKIIQGNHTSRTVRTDDMAKQADGKGHTIGGKNEQLYDIAEINHNGIYIEGSGRQLKYVGGDPDSCYQKLMAKKFDKYRDADIPIEVPSDFYDGVVDKLQKRAESLKGQINRAEQKGDAVLAQKHREQLERVEKTRNTLRKGKLTNAEALEARLHPAFSTAKDMVGVAHQSGVEAAKYGAVIGGTVSIVQNLVAVAKGDKELGDAALDVAKDTASSVAISYGTGFSGSTVKGFMQNANSGTVRALSKTNLPGILVTVSLSAAATMKRYINGEITGVECFEELGEQGTGMLSSALFATIGQITIPIPVIGGLIGGMLGYAVASASYGTLLGALKEAEIATQERKRIEAICEEQIKLIRGYRAQMETIISNYLTSYIAVFHESFAGIKNSLEIGDIDGVISSANQITEALGKKVLFNNMDEFETLMNGNLPIKL